METKEMGTYNKGEIAYISGIGKDDAYSRTVSIGTKVSFRSYINSRYSYTTGLYKEYISAYLTILEGEYEGQLLHFYEVQLSHTFPFERMMKEAICRLEE